MIVNNGGSMWGLSHLTSADIPFFPLPIVQWKRRKRRGRRKEYQQSSTSDDDIQNMPGHASNEDLPNRKKHRWSIHRILRDLTIHCWRDLTIHYHRSSHCCKQWHRDGEFCLTRVTLNRQRQRWGGKWWTLRSPSLLRIRWRGTRELP